MRVIDTSAWIEWLVNSQAGRKVAIHLPDEEEWLVPTIVQLELAKWLTREVGEDKTDEVIAFSRTCVIIELDTATALLAADLCSRFKLATADAIVYATARIHKAALITCDAHFEGLEGVLLIPKRE